MKELIATWQEMFWFSRFCFWWEYGSFRCWLMGHDLDEQGSCSHCEIYMARFFPNRKKIKPGPFLKWRFELARLHLAMWVNYFRIANLYLAIWLKHSLMKL